MAAHAAPGPREPQRPWLAACPAHLEIVTTTRAVAGRTETRPGSWRRGSSGPRVVGGTPARPRRRRLPHSHRHCCTGPATGTDGKSSALACTDTVPGLLSPRRSTPSPSSANARSTSSRAMRACSTRCRAAAACSSASRRACSQDSSSSRARASRHSSKAITDCTTHLPDRTKRSPGPQSPATKHEIVLRAIGLRAFGRSLRRWEQGRRRQRARTRAPDATGRRRRVRDLPVPDPRKAEESPHADGPVQGSPGGGTH